MGVAQSHHTVRSYASLLASAQYCSKLVRGFVSSQVVALNKAPPQFQKFDTTPLRQRPSQPISSATSSIFPATLESSANLLDDLYDYPPTARTLKETDVKDLPKAAPPVASTGATGPKYSLSELKHVPSGTLGICVLDRQNNNNPGPRYYGRGLNDSAAAAGNDHIVEVLVWQRVDVYASTAVSRFSLPDNAPKPPPSIINESVKKAGSDPWDDFFKAPTPAQAAAVVSEPPPTEGKSASAHPATGVYAGRYYRYSKHTILRGTIPVRWTTTLPNPFTLSSLGSFEAKMTFDSTPTNVDIRKKGSWKAAQSSVSQAPPQVHPATSQAPPPSLTGQSHSATSHHHHRRHTKCTDLTSDYFATVWAKLGGGRDLIEGLPIDVDQQYSSKIQKLVGSHVERGSIIGNDWAAYVPMLARTGKTTGSQTPTPTPRAPLRQPRPLLRCVNLLRQKPEYGEEDTLTQHFVEGIKRANETLFGATFSVPPQHVNAPPASALVGIIPTPPKAKLELVHVDWLRLSKEFGTHEAVGVLWANTIPFLCGGGGAREAVQSDDDGSVTTGLLIPSGLNSCVARGVLSALAQSATLPFNSALLRIPMDEAEATSLVEEGSSFTSPFNPRAGNYSLSPTSYAVTQVQSQFVRINCADSLDRTNLCSFMIVQQMVLEMTRRIVNYSVVPSDTNLAISLKGTASYPAFTTTAFAALNTSPPPSSSNLLGVGVAPSLGMSAAISPVAPPANAVFDTDSDSENEDEKPDGEKERAPKKTNVWKMFSNTVMGGDRAGVKVIAAKKAQLQLLRAQLQASHSSGGQSTHSSDQISLSPTQLLLIRMLASQVIGHRDCVISPQSALVIAGADPVAQAVWEDFAKDTLRPIHADPSANYMGSNSGLNTSGTSKSSAPRKFRAPFASTYEEMISDGVRQVRALRNTQQQHSAQQARAAAQFVDVSGDSAIAGSNTIVSSPSDLSITSSSQLSNANVTVPYGLLRALAVIYIAFGDAISMAYTNTQALHTNLLRGFAGSEHASSNAILSAKRRYENTFQDKKKMRLIDALLGRNLELHFSKLRSGPYYVAKLPINRWRNSLVIHGVPSWATEADLENAIRTAWNGFVKSQLPELRQRLPDSQSLVFTVFSAQRYHHYTPHPDSVAAMAQAVPANQHELAAGWRGAPNSDGRPAAPIVPAIQGMWQAAIGARMDLGSPKTGRGRAASVFQGTSGTNFTVAADRKPEPELMKESKRVPEEEDGFVLVEADPNADSSSSDEESLDTLRETPSVTYMGGPARPSGGHSAALQVAGHGSNFGFASRRSAPHSSAVDDCPFQVPTATNPRLTSHEPAPTSAPKGGDDDGYGLTSRELEGLVEGAKHIAVVHFADSGNIQFISPLLSMGAIAVTRSPNSQIRTPRNPPTAGAISSPSSRKNMSSYNVICQLKPFEYLFEGKGTISAAVAPSYYHSLFPVAPSDPVHYPAEQCVKYAADSSPTKPSTQARVGSPVVCISALHVFGNEYPDEARNRGAEDEDEDGAGARGTGGSRGTITAATNRAVSTFKNGFRSLVRNL